MNYVDLVIKEANKAYKKDEVPVGCLIEYNGKIISKSHNMKNRKNDVLSHAEITAIIKAQKKLKDWRLNKCNMYVTLEPCNMCKEVIKQARISKVYYVLKSEFNNENTNNTSFISLSENDKKYKDILQNFFKKKRLNNSNKPR